MENLDPRTRQQILSIVRPKGQKHLRPWHGCPAVPRVLVGVNSRIAVWRPHPGAHAIRETALHITFFENLVANILSGEDRPAEFELQKRGSPVVVEGLTEKQWRSEKHYISAVNERLGEVVGSFDPDRLDQVASERSGITAMEYIHGIVDHTLYHTAEMDLLKTLAKRALER